MADADAGIARLNAGDAPAAVDLFTRALQSKELSPERTALTYHHRGMAFHKQGQAGRAILDYTTALWNKNLPKHFRPRTLNNRGLAFEAISDFNSAMRDYNLALRLNDDYAEAYCSRGNLHRKFGRHSEAILDYDQALRNAHPQPKYVFLWQGLSLEALGKRREAMDAFRRALSIDPQFKLAKVQLQRLEASQSIDSIVGRRKLTKAPANTPVVLSATPSAQAVAVATELNAPPWTPPGSKSPAIVKHVEPPPPPKPAEADASPVLRPAIDDQSKSVQTLPTVLTPRRSPPGAGPKSIPVVAPKATVRDAPSDGEGGSDAAFALQLGSFKSEGLARSGWDTVMKSAGDLLGGLSHVVEPVALPERGTVYRLFAEALPEREGALGLCRTLRDKGIPCIVVRR